MKLEIRFLDDEGNVVMEHKATAEQPTMIKFPEKIVAGQYEIYAASYQPHVRCLYPNGQPPPAALLSSPFSGRSMPFSDMPGMQSRLGMSNIPSRPIPYQGDNGPNPNPRN